MQLTGWYKQRKKSFWGYIILLLITLGLVVYVQQLPAVLQGNKDNDSTKYEFLNATVEKAEPPAEDGDEVFSVRAKEGPERGRLVRATESSLNSFNQYHPGDNILLVKTSVQNSKEFKYEIADFYHQDGLLWSFVIFAAVTMLIARWKGLTAIVSVVFSLLLFFVLFIKMVQAGFSPLLACMVFTTVVTLLTIPMIHGFNRKSLAAMTAIFLGYLVSIGLVFLFKYLARLGDTPGEEFRLLGVMYSQISLSEILIASIFLGAVGALIDTAVSISSAVFEAMKEHTSLTFRKVSKVGMEVGKDILGSMTNTLLFAYLASSLPFLLLISLGQVTSVREMINTDFIALELTRTFIGAVSLVVMIPVAATASAWLLTQKRERKTG
jgi:uncharacterized membrane protein